MMAETSDGHISFKDYLACEKIWVKYDEILTLLKNMRKRITSTQMIMILTNLQHL